MASGIYRRDFLKASARAGLLLGFDVGKSMGSLSTTPYDIVIRNGTVVDGLNINADKATYTDAEQYHIGIDYVIVNGKVVVDHGAHSGELAGKVLYGPGEK